MSVTWYSDEPPERPAALTLADRLRMVRRGVPALLVLMVCFLALLALRLIERPVFGLCRPVTPYLTRIFGRCLFWIIGLRIARQGRPMVYPGAIAANHSSWLDIFALHAFQNVYFVSKAEVAGWPGIGWLASAVGSVFIRRNRAEARDHTNSLRDRLTAGHHLVIFPEGTSTDGRRVLPFKSTLFQAFLSDQLPADLHIQPVTLIYRAADGVDPRFYGWWGDMEFGDHLIRMLTAPRHGSVTVQFHPPIPVADCPDRKALARRSEDSVRLGLSAAEPKVVEEQAR
ncbi:1-acyl-sn-glycerol-3-phosphate acyltransferase [Actibacterium sp. 188UL27-1]|uniref:lysophospholipid acyltransferase family protein n=1 Tax=Actibacterium sp. 188UL27-1 TaxID=2786961 RepID=UPI00195D2C3D|nr:lysophospholipid acyltransferase family protein [Actibacterium sp. 188UL27-1]MBM7067602.1 1-acyl-sn-glycerol-3-phosphate acyltransferase [Actibacterium sp. 188UL27-1]